MTRNKLSYLLQYDSSLTQVYTLTPLEISQLLNLSLHKATLFYKDLHNKQRFEMMKKLKSPYTIVTILDKYYPSLLKEIVDPPLILNAIGNIDLMNCSPAISVIGTRNPTGEAFKKMKMVLRPLIEKNWVLVSGMAKGIDSYAHQIALAYSGQTIAVLGGGFKHIYPKQNIRLFHQIAKQGLVLSEYAPSTPPKRYHFPERNRIISGLSLGTFVIEAKERSGTMITVDQALDQGREVYAMPGSPLLQQTKGCHQMIQQGAKLVVEADDILEDWIK